MIGPWTERDAREHFAATIDHLQRKAFVNAISTVEFRKLEAEARATLDRALDLINVERMHAAKVHARRNRS